MIPCLGCSLTTSICVCIVNWSGTRIKKFLSGSLSARSITSLYKETLLPAPEAPKINRSIVLSHPPNRVWILPPLVLQ